jgi:hypothetical protein
MIYRIVQAPTDARGSLDDLGLPGDPYDVSDKFAALLRFLDRAPLRLTIDNLADTLRRTDPSDVAVLLGQHGLSAAVLEAALIAREKLARLGDVIHAAAIALLLPDLLEPGEVVMHASLDARADPEEPFDLVTDRRVCQFHVAIWNGSDATAKRMLVRDLIYLAALAAERRPDLYVLGEWPLRFLSETDVPVSWAIRGSAPTEALYLERFGDPDTPISRFRLTEASHVSVTDIGPRLTARFADR